MAQQDIKQIRGASQGSVLFLGTNSVVSEDYNKLNWDQSNNIFTINGNVKITDGNQTDGYILRTDANGLGTWVDPSSISANGTGSTGFGTYWSTSNDLDFMNISVTQSTGDIRYIDFDTTYALDSVTGRLNWNSEDGTLDLGLSGDVTLQIGQESHYYVKNQTGGTLLNGRLVSAVGTDGASGRITASYSIADGSVEPRFIMGIVTDDIVNGGDGYVTHFGKVRGIDASGAPYSETWNNGDILYANPNINGGLTNVEPSSPNLKVVVALVIDNSATVGSIFVRVANGFRLRDLHDVATYATSSLTDNDFLRWSTTGQYWTYSTLESVLELNDLSDVTTGLPATPSVADDGKILFYDTDVNQWITDDTVNHGTVVINAKTNGGNIQKGTPVYLTGFDNDIHVVATASAASSATMPVIGLAGETLNDTTSKHVITFGKIQGIDTTSGGALSGGESWSINDDLYVDTTSGQLTNIRPIGSSTPIQRVAKVLNVSAGGGQLFVFNTARTAGLPNLLQDNIWVGSTANQPITTTFSFEYLTDVNLTSATLNDTLRYDGTNWVNNSFVTIDSGGTLSVSGTFKYVDGNQQSGYVLTSDGNGFASWSQSQVPTQSISELTISGTQNGSNRDYTLSSSLTFPNNLFFINGQLVNDPDDYVISGTALTIDSSVPAPIESDSLRLFGSVGSISGSGILSLNGLTLDTQTFTSSSPDSTIDFNINSSSSTHTFTANVSNGSIGSSKLNANGGATAGYVLESNGDGTFNWVVTGAGSITEVIAATGVTGGGSASSVELQVIGSNGITSTDEGVKLGGTINENTSLFLNNTLNIFGPNNTLVLGGAGGNTLDYLDVRAKDILLQATEPTGGGGRSITVESGYTYSLTFGSGGLGGGTITDSSGSGYGLVYTADYSPTFVSYSLVTKGYVDANSGGSSRIPSSVQTTNNTPTELEKIDTLTDNATNIVEVYVKAYQSGASQYGVWKRTLTVTKVSGTPTIREVNADVDKTSSGLNANSISFTVNGGDIDLDVTGIAATTIDWESAYEIIL